MDQLSIPLAASK